MGCCNSTSDLLDRIACIDSIWLKAGWHFWGGSIESHIQAEEGLRFVRIVLSLDALKLQPLRRSTPNFIHIRSIWFNVRRLIHDSFDLLLLTKYKQRMDDTLIGKYIDLRKFSRGFVIFFFFSFFKNFSSRIGRARKIYFRVRRNRNRTRSQDSLETGGAIRIYGARRRRLRTMTFIIFHEEHRSTMFLLDLQGCPFEFDFNYY